MSDEIKGMLLGVIGVAIFSVTLPATRIAVLGGLDTVFVAYGRCVVAALAAAVILVVTRQPIPPRRHWKRLVCVVFGIVLGVLPLATTAAAAVICRERPSLKFWAVALLGSALVVGFALIKGGGDLQAADLLLLAAAYAGTGYTLSGNLSRSLGGWQVICWVLIFSLPFIVPPVLWVLPDVDWRVPWPAWGGFFYVALLSQLIGFFAWNRGLALGGVSRVGQVQLLQLFMTLAASAWLLGEDIDQVTLIFAIAVVGVVAVGRRMPVTRWEKREGL